MPELCASVSDSFHASTYMHQQRRSLPALALVSPTWSDAVTRSRRNALCVQGEDMAQDQLEWMADNDIESIELLRLGTEDDDDYSSDDSGLDELPVLSDKEVAILRKTKSIIVSSVEINGLEIWACLPSE